MCVNFVFFCFPFCFAYHFLDKNVHHPHISMFVDAQMMKKQQTQPQVMEVSPRKTMKGAAKCDKHRELQD